MKLTKGDEVSAMKLTKAKLKQIIKEVVGESFEDGSPEKDQEAVDLVREVVLAWDAAHKHLSDFPESQKIFEEYLKSNLELYLKRWGEDRERHSNV